MARFRLARFRREPEAVRMEQRALTLGALLDVCAALGIGTSQPVPEVGTPEQAYALLDALDVHTVDREGTRREVLFTGTPRMQAARAVRTARLALEVFLDRKARAEARDGALAEKIEAEVGMLAHASPGAANRYEMEHALASFDPADYVALLAMPLGVATRYFAARSAHAVIQERLREHARSN